MIGINSSSEQKQYKTEIPKGLLYSYSPSLSQWGKSSDAFELGVMGMKLFKKAKVLMDRTCDPDNIYATQCFKLSADGHFGNEQDGVLRNPPGSNPEPPYKTNPLERPPRETARWAKNEFRDSALR